MQPHPLNRLLNHLRQRFTGTLRRQLISGVAIVHAVLMALFVWDLTVRQHDLLLERQTEQAQALARSVSTSAAGWVASRDLYGLQEIITAQSRYPELLFAMILDNNGRVLAHSDTSRLGLYVSDLPEEPSARVLTQTPALVDAVNPVILADRHIGWVRLGLGQETTAQRLASITRDGILYAIVAILIGSALAWYMGTRLTRKLREIQRCADAVEQGDLHHRADIDGCDEVAHVAHAFNQMLDSVISSHRELEQSDERFNLAMQASNDGLWDWDLSTGRVYYSPRWKAMLGYDTTELDDNFHVWETLVDPDDRHQTMQLVDACCAGITPGFKTEFRMRHKQGHWVHILSRGILVTDSAGKPVRMVGTHSDISDKKQKEQIIWNQANFDMLTSLPNRKLFHELLDHEIKLAHRNKMPLWVLFLDLDGFKEINDNYGHHQGDQLLIQVAERIRTAMRESDTVARFGGDEFVIILSHITDIVHVNKIAAKLIDDISQAYELNNHKIFISASIGIANYPNDAHTTIDLLKFADQSMYMAKREGKNRFSYFTPSLQKSSAQRAQISTDLRQAITHDHFQLHYQPVIDLESHRICKAEVLIRWSHPQQGFISPTLFIPIAEETGIICDIGTWVFNRAFAQLEQWRSMVPDDFQLSINMSPLQLKTTVPEYDDWLNDLSADSISGHRVVVEITEGLLLENQPLVSKRLLQYRDAGVQVAIDDFGTGYSSLAYLKEFDIDYLKIDQSFIRNLHHGSSEHSLCEAIAVMAHKLGLEVIAEGVETEEQYRILKDIGCDYAQGYLFSRPLPATRFEEHFLAHGGRADSALTT